MCVCVCVGAGQKESSVWCVWNNKAECSSRFLRGGAQRTAWGGINSSSACFKAEHSSCLTSITEATYSTACKIKFMFAPTLLRCSTPPLLLRLCCTERKRWSGPSVTWRWSTTSCLASPRTSRTSSWFARLRTCSTSTLHLYWPSGQRCSLTRGERRAIETKNG